MTSASKDDSSIAANQQSTDKHKSLDKESGFSKFSSEIAMAILPIQSGRFAKI
jgi:hypothetical protein